MLTMTLAPHREHIISDSISQSIKIFHAAVVEVRKVFGSCIASQVFLFNPCGYTLAEGKFTAFFAFHCIKSNCGIKDEHHQQKQLLPYSDIFLTSYGGLILALDSSQAEIVSDKRSQFVGPEFLNPQTPSITTAIPRGSGPTYPLDPAVTPCLGSTIGLEAHENVLIYLRSRRKINL